MASSSGHGRMWGHAYSVTPSAILVPPESSITKPRDLANIEVGVGYHSGSYFSAIQALEKVLKPDEIKLGYIGQPPGPFGCACWIAESMQPTCLVRRYILPSNRDAEEFSTRHS